MRHKFIEGTMVVNHENGCPIRLFTGRTVYATTYETLMDTWRFKHAGVWCYCYPTKYSTKSGNVIYVQSMS